MTDDSQRWIRGFRTNDESAVADFWNRYEERLRRLAERNLSERMKRHVDADDVVQSVFRTFLRRAGQGKFELQDRQNVLSLLTTITLNKIRHKVRHYAAQKRGGDNDQYFETMADLGGDQPTPDEVVALQEIEDLLRGFDEEQQQVVELKLQNHTNEEVARRLQCSERTVRRMLKKVQHQLEKLVTADE
ncbi:MAG: sigma-70 family RNA polymerase sigma factor [Pirellulales bacterium]